MEKEDLEQLMSVCNQDMMVLTDKMECLELVSLIIALKPPVKRYNSVIWTKGMVCDRKFYLDYIKGTFEDNISMLLVRLMTLANKLRMNLVPLCLGREKEDRQAEDLVMSLLRIALSHYKIRKKVIVMIGILVDYCNANSINVCWFARLGVLNELKK